MLRHALLAGAAAVVLLPAVGWSQPSQPSPTDQSAQDVNRSGSAYTQAPPQSAEPGVTTGEQTTTAPATGSQAAPTQSIQVNEAINTGRNVAVVADRRIPAKDYVNKTAMQDNFQIQAANIALQRSKNDTVRQFANDMIQQHQQITANVTQAALQSGITPNARLDRPHLDQLQKLRQAPADRFDQAYMNNQLNAQMQSAALHQSYAANGDTVALQQVAANTVPNVQHSMNVAWSDSGAEQRFADQRNREQDKLASAETRRTTTYRGYTVIGPTKPSQVRYRHRHGAGVKSSTRTPATYQGYTSQPSGSAAPGVTQPGSAAPGTPQSQGLPPGTASPRVTQPGVTQPGVTQPGATPGTPQYQGYTTQPYTTPPQPVTPQPQNTPPPTSPQSTTPQPSTPQPSPGPY